MPVLNQARQRVIQTIFIVVFLVIIGQLFHLQILSSKYTKLAEDNAITKKIVYPSRGIIYDRNKKPILDNVARFDLVVTPFQIKGIDTTTLCRILNIDTAEFRKRMVTSIIKNGRYRPSVFEPLVSPQLQAQLDENLYKFPGFDLNERPVRSYPFKCAAHILGYVAEVDTAIIRKSGYFYQMGDYVGRSGLEASYEKVLMGQRGIRFLIKDNKNRIQGSFDKGNYDTLPVAGRNLYSSVDVVLQQLAEKLMTNKIGGVVAINPKTGGILAMASGPGYDPNLLAGVQFRKNWGRMALDTARPLYNRAIKGQYPPGSTFKPLGALVALDEGLITPAYGYGCWGGYYAVDPSIMGMGPVPATKKALQRAGLTINDIDLIEMNEAFASQSLACIRELNINTDILNVNGGSIAIGHPLGCSGVRISATLLYEMKRRNVRYGLATMCVGVGQGAAVIYEKL